MATAISPVTAVAAVVGPSRPSVGRTRVRYINGLTHSEGSRHTTTGERAAAALSTSTYSKVAEIFRIAAIMNGITLVGVAIGFVLLRIEAIVEEE
ncbi:hypothetical protein SASPL_128804 [Salvia splendens]|uniref:Cytochrome b6-f complex subunit 7 n=1 Tax=Salvia splendens TaxID=180675 RepID=A0A8X8XD71_SALSN|nr:hypothetical protein SASPL_128804 [Salvia splendens]